MNQVDAREHLQGLVGTTITTLSGRPNTVLRVQGDVVIVGTQRSPGGQPVPIEWVQAALDDLLRTEKSRSASNPLAIAVRLLVQSS
jgi:hypothetical protein